MVTHYITPNLYITRDESLIIDMLVDHKEMPKSFESSKVLSFYNDKDFHMALYIKDQADRGFQMYVIEDFSIHVADIIILRGIFTKLMKEGYGHQMLPKACDQLDNMIHMARTFRAMLNPGIPDSSEED